MSAPRNELDLDLDGRRVHVSSLDRVLWPGTGTTKADLVAYYVSVAPALLPHLRGHPCALHRFPDGVLGAHFYAIRCPSRPDWVRTVRLAPEQSGKVVDIALVEDLATLVWTAQLSAIELHPYPGTADDFERSDVMVLDLDPGPPAGIREVATVAVALRDLLASAGRMAYPKTSGAKGLHLHVPLGRPEPIDAVKDAARELASLVAGLLPDLAVTRKARSARAGRVYLDWGQNDAWKSMVAAYSLRGQRTPTVATPVTWEEVSAAASGATPLVFSPSDVVRRLDVHGELFAPLALTTGAEVSVPAERAAADAGARRPDASRRSAG